MNGEANVLVCLFVHMTLFSQVKILQEGVVAGDIGSTDAHSQTSNDNHSSGSQRDERQVKSQDDSDNVSAGDNSSGVESVSTAESASMTDNNSMADNVSVASHGSASTAVTANAEADELIEKLKGMFFFLC